MATEFKGQERDVPTLESSILVHENTWAPIDYTNGSDTTSGNTDAILNAIFGSVVTLATFWGQIIVITVVSRDQRLRTPKNYSFISLAVSDLFLSIISMPTWTVYSTLGYWPLSHTLCNVWNTLDYVLSVVSIYTILFMSVERYLSTRFPIKYRVEHTATKAKVALILIWVGTTIAYSLFVWLTQLFMAQDPKPEPCVMYYLNSFPLTFTIVTLAFWTPIFATALFYFLTFTNTMICCKPNAAGTVEPPADTIEMSDRRTFSRSDTPRTRRFTSNGVSITRRNRYMCTKKSKAMKTIFLHLIPFAICWLPLSVVLLFEPLKPGYLSRWWMTVAYWLGYAKSMLNPVCFGAMNKRFRKALYELCRC